MENDTNNILKAIDVILNDRKSEDADTSYVASLYQQGTEKILKKVSEECTETVMASKDLCKEPNSKTNQEHLIYEVADLWFHTQVLLAHHNLSSQAVLQELARRFGQSGHAEKANR
jgi:phosphoribosyl-ATP pyrophosphohydrolase